MQKERIILQIGNTVRAPNGTHYIIEELLGKGGFGAVYLVRVRQDAHKLFALKEVINPSERDRERFVGEASLLKRLKHRALPQVYDVFENEKLKRVYMLMDYVRGKDSEALLAEQPEQHFSLPLALAIMAPIVDALTYMHNQVPPIVHRDIKPANIIVSTRGEEAVLVDFGLAKEYVSDKTTAVIRHGSPGYAALEQYGHGGTTHRTDVYGLGATLYTLLTGVVPIDVIRRITESKGFDPLEPASLINPEIPTAVAKAIQRAMSISVEDRFNSVEEFWQELTAHATEQQEDGSVVTMSKLASTPLKLPKPLTVTEQELTPVTTTILEKQRETPRLRRHTTLFVMTLSLLLIGVLGTGFFFTVGAYRNSLSNHAATTILQTTKTSTTHAFTPTSPANASLYPTIVSSYGGTIADITANSKTAMFLINVQQNHQKIHGLFKGLGLAGTFNGTVTTSGRLQFRITIYNGTSTLAFEGTIKIGGDIVGSYQVLDQSGQRTGESGLWNVSPSP